MDRRRGLIDLTGARCLNGRTQRSALYVLSAFLCVLGPFLALSSGTAAAQDTPASVSITGRIISSNGKTVAGMPILLSGAAVSQRTTSDAAGAFKFRGLPTGRYRLTTDPPTARMASTWVDVRRGTTAQVALRLDDGPDAVQGGGTSPVSTQAMQFADDPHFAIAGITDWTAAGGHGSDASLRTSEALTRETLDLQADDAPPRPHACADDATALRDAAARQPDDFEANHCLGIFYLGTADSGRAVKSLSIAYRLQPSDAANEYALARAYEKAGDAAKARGHMQALAANHGEADLHRFAGDLDESLDDPVAAVNEFARAVRIDPSEENYFSWGSELLYHRAVIQARDVFEQGVQAWPGSPRMLTALGAALFAGARYDDAAERFCQAAALEPDNPEPEFFMGRIEMAAPHPLPCVAQKLRDFHQRHPGNALADYYYAMSLWKQEASPLDAAQRQQVASLLHEAVTADPRCGEAWLQLGNLQAQSGDYVAAIPLYSKAADASPKLTEAWYRLGIAYDRTGQRDKARQALAQHDTLAQQQAAQVQQQRLAIKQFVVSAADPKRDR